jgi:hypothetical protein
MADKPHFFWRSVWTDFIFGRKKLFAWEGHRSLTLVRTTEMFHSWISAQGKTNFPIPTEEIQFSKRKLSNKTLDIKKNYKYCERLN